jgi:peptidyl-prolyl cis-trans isomerase A (cyclophilin A)
VSPEVTLFPIGLGIGSAPLGGVYAVDCFVLCHRVYNSIPVTALGHTLMNSEGSPPLVEVRGAHFAFTIAVCIEQAPISGAYFLADVDAGVLDGSSIFRIVRVDNQPANLPEKIEVIQMGVRENNPTIPAVIQHEPTSLTGLRHRRGTVSLARFAPGAVYHSIFVCMRDEPCLDAGGMRNPDGLGFAAFGYVAEGFDELQRIFKDHAYGVEYLGSPIRLRTWRRVSR